MSTWLPPDLNPTKVEDFTTERQNTDASKHRRDKKHRHDKTSTQKNAKTQICGMVCVSTLPKVVNRNKIKIIK